MTKIKFYIIRHLLTNTCRVSAVLRVDDSSWPSNCYWQQFAVSTTFPQLLLAALAMVAEQSEDGKIGKVALEVFVWCWTRKGFDVEHYPRALWAHP